MNDDMKESDTQQIIILWSDIDNNMMLNVKLTAF